VHAFSINFAQRQNHYSVFLYKWQLRREPITCTVSWNDGKGAGEGKRQ
jgi:hypothetical protein